MTFILKSLDIERARGISAGQSFRVDGLGRRVTIVHGPNGAGKSTMAMAVQEVLWPGESGLEKPFLKAEWEVDGRSWPVAVEAGHAVGSVEDRPDVGPSGRRGRYVLALHELVVLESGTEAEFVNRLVKASLGGYDVKAAVGRLNFTAKPGRSRTLETELRRTEDHVRETQARQRELADDEAQLGTLRQKHAAARQAQREAELLSLAMDVRKKDRFCRELEARVHAYGPAVQAMRGTEAEELERIQQGLGEANKEIERLETLVEQSRRGRIEAGFPNGLPSATDRQVWQDAIDTLENIALRRPESRSRLADARSVLEDASDALYDVAPSETLTRAHALEWSELWRAWAELRAERLALDHREAVFSAVLEQQVDQIGDTEMAHRLLAQWLRAPDNRTLSSDSQLMVALGLATVAVLLLAWIVHPAFLAAVLLIGVVYAWSHRDRTEDGRTTRAQVERAWELEAGMPPLTEWSETDVLARYQDLVAMHLVAARREDAEREARTLDRERKSWTDRYTRLMERVDALEQDSGLRAPAEMDSAAWLGIMAQRLVSVEQAREQVRREEGVLKDLSEREADVIHSLSAQLAVFGVDGLESPAAARTAVRAVLARVESYTDHDRAFVDASSTLENSLRPRRAKLEADRAAVLGRMDLEVGLEHRVADLLERHAQLVATERELTETRAVLAHDRTRLEDRAADAGLPVEPLLEMSEEALQSRLDELASRALQAEKWHADITRIETRLEAARAGHDMTDALQARDLALEKLADHGLNASRLIAGQFVADWVQQEVMRRAMPDVFKRAKSLLARFTAGALQLEIDLAGQEPKFMARTAGSAPRPISELSVGERVQLLIAVRVAFLEHEEVESLPLLVDEALGTSDDDRARIIIDTLLQLALEGRQIFYFTAQWDEVEKWKERMAASGIAAEDWQVVDLAEIRELEATRRSPMPDGLLRVRTIPAPDGRSHGEYGRALGVPGLDPLNRNADAEHIWHIVEDVDHLYALVQAGVDTVHAWRSMDKMDHDVCGSSRNRTVVRLIDNALEEAVALWRTGRGRPVDRAVLEDSGAISDTYIDIISGLATVCEGDAARIMDAIESRDFWTDQEKNKLRSDKIDALREYFLSEGYLSDKDTLGASDARIQLMIRCPDVPQHTLERIIKSLWTTD